MDKLNKLANAVFVVFVIMLIYILYFYYNQDEPPEMDTNDDGIISPQEIKDYIKKRIR